MRKTIKRAKNKLRYKFKTKRKIHGGDIRTDYYHFSSRPLNKEDFKNINNSFINNNLNKSNFNNNNNNNNKNNSNNSEFSFSEMSSGLKPGGLWLSKGKDWEEYAEYKYAYKVSFNDANMLILDTFDKIKDFTDTYKIVTNNEYYAPINWRKVAREKDGVIFDNYKEIKRELLKSFHPMYSWFMAVDINSACTWRPNKTITEWEQIEE